MNNRHQVYLWIGPEEELRSRSTAFVQRQLCKQEGCATCHTCRAVLERRHYALTWLVPENYYSVKQLEPLFKTVCFALSPGEKHIIVIERADLLTTTCANSLLKSLEEPPEGYQYILLAPRTDGILPTIISRCIKEEFESGNPQVHRLLPYFMKLEISLAPEFLKEIEKDRVPENEIGYLLDSCMFYWHENLKNSLRKGDAAMIKRAQSIEAIIEEARKKMPMPGSSKLFLKNLFLSLTLAI